MLSDIDEITGDPTVRENIRNLIYGLSDLLSSVEMLEYQTQIAIALAPLEQRAASTPLHNSAITLSRADYRALQTQLTELANRQPTSTNAGQ